MDHRAGILLLLFCHFSSGEYIFPGCEVQAETEIEVGTNNLTVLLSPIQAADVTVEVTQEQQNVTFLKVPVPPTIWSNTEIILTDNVYVKLANGSFYPEEKERKPLTSHPIKTVKVSETKGVVKNCPQGLPYKVINTDPEFFPSPAKEEKEEVYIMYPPKNMTVQILFCQYPTCSGYLCWNEDNEKMEVKTEVSNCHKLPHSTFYRIHFQFMDKDVKVMNENGEELNTLTFTSGFRPSFKTMETSDNIYVIQCIEKDCESSTTHSETTSPQTASHQGAITTLSVFVAILAVAVIVLITLLVIVRSNK